MLYEDLQRRAEPNYPKVAALSVIAIKHLHHWWRDEVTQHRTVRDFYGWATDMVTEWPYTTPVEVWARQHEDAQAS